MKPTNKENGTFVDAGEGIGGAVGLVLIMAFYLILGFVLGAWLW